MAATGPTIDWNPHAGTGSSDWNIGTNWDGGTAPANDVVTNIARFNQTVYNFQPTANANRAIAGLIFGDGITNTTALTITSGTAGNRLIVGGDGIVMNASAGPVTVGAAATQGITVNANQTWQNDSGSLLSITSVSNDANVTPFTSLWLARAPEE